MVNSLLYIAGAMMFSVAVGFQSESISMAVGTLGVLLLVAAVLYSKDK